MKLLWGDKDGGPESKSRAYGLEIKSLFSVLMLRFDEGSREAFHSHAFNALSWVLNGILVEIFLDGSTRTHTPSWKPICTSRATTHQVRGTYMTNWALTFRGPWRAMWRDISKDGDLTLAHGRRVVK